jgi:hypothetical protein
MREELNALFTLFDKAAVLEDTINSLESKIESIENSLNNKSNFCNWVVLSHAAKQLGLTTSALRQRIKRDQYPQGIVWRQKETKSTIFINLETIQEYL